ncbi:MAG: hypothetical protein KC422_07380 [Trueperaceae bacterium]|nr:hypothetical protein [Trueperaceae bacterium]
MKKTFVVSLIWGLILVLSACQNTNLDVEDLDTTASTSWGADIGSKVWLDRNFNGKKELYEPGVAGITVNLWSDIGKDGIADEKLSSMQTDSKGQYRFNALDPDVNYIVEFVAPSGYIFSSKRVTNELNSDFDSDANANGFTDSIDALEGIYNFRIDAAIYQGEVPSYPVGNTRIGSRVWQDTNDDGIKQATERGFSNITLNLWWDKDKNGTPDEIIKTLKTDDNGFYRFEGLDGTASFLLEVVLPLNYRFSPKNNPAAPGSDWDSDINPSTGFSDVLSLVPNTLNYTYDAGIARIPGEPPIIYSIDDQVVLYGERNLIDFEVRDENPDSLIFRLSSSKQNLVKNSSLKVLGTGTKRQLEISPEASWGSLNIYLTVVDEQGLIEVSAFRMVIAIAETQRLIASDAANQQRFGKAVAISGDYAIVGASNHPDVGEYSGAAYILKRIGNSWIEQTKLQPGDAEFGQSVAISANYAIVGVRDDYDVKGGRAYIFKRDGDTWTQQIKLVPSDGAENDGFGWAVAISDDYAMVGSSRNNTIDVMAGTVYIFKREGDNWVEQNKLFANDTDRLDSFGISVAISGDYLVVGAEDEDDRGRGSGAAYIFRRSGDQWVEQAKLTASDAKLYDYFGSSVAISGDYTIIGAFGETTTGAAYIFKRSGDNWIEQVKLKASDRYTGGGLFGFSVSISGDFALVGAARNYGSAYLFRREGESWVEQNKLKAKDATRVDGFAESVALSGDYLLVGAPYNGAESENFNRGAVYIYGK